MTFFTLASNEGTATQKKPFPVSRACRKLTNRVWFSMAFTLNDNEYVSSQWSKSVVDSGPLSEQRGMDSYRQLQISQSDRESSSNRWKKALSSLNTVCMSWYLTIIPWDCVWYEVINNQRARSASWLWLTYETSSKWILFNMRFSTMFITAVCVLFLIIYSCFFVTIFPPIA